jgi:hypothetical protein
MNYLLPQREVMAMHCSANYGKDENDVAVFFGLSGTGKTTLSADPERTLIGDDEHGWSDHGVFNFEGGCYVKVIRLSREGEPEIYETTRRFGTILENVAIDSRSRRIDLDDSSLIRGIPGKRKTITISRHESWPICLRRTSGKTQATLPRRSEMQDLPRINMAINQKLTNIIQGRVVKSCQLQGEKGFRLSGKKTVIFRQSRFILPAFLDRQKGRV